MRCQEKNVVIYGWRKRWPGDRGPLDQAGSDEKNHDIIYLQFYYYTSIYVMFTLNIHCSVVHGNTYVDFRTYVICLLFEYCVGRRRDKAMMKRDWFRPVEGNQISRCLRCSLGQDLEDIDMAQRNIVI